MKGEIMSSYVVLGRLGSGENQAAPTVLLQAGAAAVGGRVLQSWLTLGGHDLVAVVELPGAVAAGAMVQAIKRHGGLEVSLLETVPPDEVAGMLGQSPTGDAYLKGGEAQGDVGGE